MKIYFRPQAIMCGACDCVLQNICLPNAGTGKYIAQCSNRWCKQYGDTIEPEVYVMDAASTNSLRDWPADAP